MPHKFALARVPAGVAANAARKGDKLTVLYRHLLTSQDGVLLTDALEGFLDTCIRHVPDLDRLPRSSIDHALAVIERTKDVTLYVNELKFSMVIRQEKGRTFTAGDPISVDDAIEISEVSIGNVHVPPDAGMVLLVSHRWRRALFYDFGPLHPQKPVMREYKLEQLLAQIFSELVFQDWLRISEDTWVELLRQRWFPFRALPLPLTKQIISHADHRWDIDELLDDIAKITCDLAQRLLSVIGDEPVLSDHVTALQTGLERYVAGDYVSAIHTLYARLEGVLRTFRSMRASDDRFGQKYLVETSTAGCEGERLRQSPTLPQKFTEYLESVFFADFDPKAPKNAASRNSVAHGVVSAIELSPKNATLAVLILYQLLQSAPVVTSTSTRCTPL